MDLDERILLLLRYKKFLLLLKKRRTIKDRQKERRFWVHPINEKREQLGVYANLIQELRLDTDNRRFVKYLRMTPENFDYVLQLVAPLIAKEDTNMREAIKPGVKLAVTLHHLAEGSSHAAISAHYRLGRSTVSGIIEETCKALWDVLQPIYMQAPRGPDQWKAVAGG